MRRRVSPREAKRMMQRMGLNMGEMQEVQEVIFKTIKKEIVVENPQVTTFDLHGQKIFQVIGEKITERVIEKDLKEIVIPDEDVRLVADQTGKSIVEAKRALEEAEGDLAKAIILLQTKA